MDLQIDIQKECKREISYKNLRNFKGFKETTEKFLLDNLHNLGQIKIIENIFENIYEEFTDEFIEQLNNLTRELLQRENNKEIIKECFMAKYNDFELRNQSFNYSFN